MMQDLSDHPNPPDPKPPASLQTHWMRLADAERPTIKALMTQYSDYEPRP